METDLIYKSLELPNGARFYKCALQVNPFEYLTRQKKKISFSNETEYNNAIVQECKQQGIEVVAITDHYRIDSAKNLDKAIRDAGLHSFPGFEAVTKDAVHILCLFDPNCSYDTINRILGDCGIHNSNTDSPPGKYDSQEFLEKSREWNAICIAAHVVSDGGLLINLRSQARVNAWKSPNLLACSLAGHVDQAPENLRSILSNTDPSYKRDLPIAILNAQDIHGPSDFLKSGAWCWIKMSGVTIDGLRQAFLDPDSRIRLSADEILQDHVELSAITWQGGFLDGQAIHFNENLNVLVGGRGAGKSTIVESLRYAINLDPIGEEAQKAHQGIIGDVLKNGTKISVFVQSYRPSKQRYRIERTIPNPPVVRDEDGAVLSITPQDILPKIEVYGQHEISELTKSPGKLTRLLDRFMEHTQDLTKRKNEIQRELERSRLKISEINREINQVAENLAALPRFEETLKRFQDAGLEEKLKEQSILVKEERIINTIPERISVFRELLNQFRKEMPIDLTFLSAKALEELGGKEIIVYAKEVIEKLNKELESIVTQLEQAIVRTDKDVTIISSEWEEKRKKVVQSAYEKILRDLQKSSVDGEEFIRMRRKIEELKPLIDRQFILQQQLEESDTRRRNLIVEWDDIKSQEFRALERAAKKVTGQLANKVQVKVSFEGNREPLLKLLKEQAGGRLQETNDVLTKMSSFSLNDFSAALREGAETIQKKYRIVKLQAERLAALPLENRMQINELYLPHTTKIELNVAAEGQPAVWQALEALSTGQKATAVLLLLLLESNAPLVVDQPEDDLDNRFITESIVPKMKEEKQKRQFIFATHNANIPVLGDAELIVGLQASGEGGQGHAEIPREQMGSLDTKVVRDMVEEILEGGKEAFEMRRLKYGF